MRILIQRVFPLYEIIQKSRFKKIGLKEDYQNAQ